MKSTTDKLQVLLNLYHNPEKDFYNSMEKLLLQGINIEFTGPTVINEKLWDEIQWLEFAELHLKNSLYLISNTNEYIDLGYKFLICNDETISLKIQREGSLNVHNFNIDLKEYSSYLNSTSTLKNNLDINKPCKFSVTIKVIKFNQMRKDAHKWYLDDNPLFIQETLEDLLNNLKNQIKSTILKNNKKFTVLKERITLWGTNVSKYNKSDLIKKVDSLSSTDFGIKNTIELYLFCHFFYYYNLNNKKFLKQVETTLISRKNMQNKLLKEYND